MSLRSVLKLVLLGWVPVALALSPGAGAAAERISFTARSAQAPKLADRLPDDIMIRARKSALQIDVEQNPVYTDAAIAALVDQIQTGFSEFDQTGRKVTKKSPYDFGLPGAIAPTKSQPVQLERISLEDPYLRKEVAQVCAATGSCEMPLDYNISIPSVKLVWSFRNASERNRFLGYINESSSRRLDLSINGEVLRRRAVNGIATRNFDYQASYETGGACGQSMSLGCLVVVVQRGAWFDGPAPWTDWNVRIEGSRKVSNILGQSLTYVERTAQRTVRAKSQVKDFFTATIGKSTMSERCTTCHRIDTPQKIVDQHTPGYTSVEQIGTDPSIVNADEEVNYCSNCHESGLPQDFHETRWATPTPMQDINWGEIINDNPSEWPLEICDRVVGNLESAEARREHFHEDARLFWAVADGEVQGFDVALPTAHPNDYDRFLDHFDAWNAAGAPCPN